MRKIEVFTTGPYDWFAHAHCKCGTTMSSGIWYTLPQYAIDEAMSGLADHIAEGREGCGHVEHVAQLVTEGANAS